MISLHQNSTNMPLYQLSDSEMKSSSSSYHVGKNQILCNQLPISVVSSSNDIGNASSSSSNLPSGLANIPKKPMRPLTAYHIFFQIEREYVIQTTAGEDADKSIHKNKVLLDNVPARYRDIKLLTDWYAGPGKRQKRKHRKQHGKIGFLELSRVISTRWSKLGEIDPDTKAFVTKIAQQELEEYYEEMKEYKELTKDIMPAAEDAAAAPKKKKQSSSNKKAKRRNSATTEMISPVFQQMLTSNYMAQQSQSQTYPDMVSSYGDFVSPGSMQFKNDVEYFMSRINDSTRHLLPRPNMFERISSEDYQQPPQKKQRMDQVCFGSDPSFDISNYLCQPIEENKQCTEVTPSCVSPPQCPSPSTTEVDLCDDDILQLWRASHEQ